MRHRQPSWPHQLMGNLQQGTPVIPPHIETWIEGRFWRSRVSNLRAKINTSKTIRPTGPEPKTAEEENNAILRLSFPRKLWKIVEDAAFTSTCWNDEVIEVDLSQMEVLQRRGLDQIFETDSIKSFISELNLYEFSKIHPSGRSAGKMMMMVT